MSDTDAKAGKLLGDYRRSHGLTQAELAGKCGLSRSTIANMETGRVRCSLKNWNAAGRVVGLVWKAHALGSHRCPEFDFLRILPNSLEWGDDPERCRCGRGR